MKSGEPFNPIGLFHHYGVPKALASRDDISNGAKLLWAILNGYCGPNGLVYPKQEDLARDMGCSIQNIRLLVKQLEKSGLIRITRPTGLARLEHLHNRYEFIWREWMDVSLRVGDSSGPHYQTSSSADHLTSSSANKQSIINTNTSLSRPAGAGAGTDNDLGVLEVPAKKKPPVKVKDDPDLAKWVKRAKRLSDRINAVAKFEDHPNLTKWAKTLRQLHTVNKVPVEEIKRYLYRFIKVLPEYVNSECPLVIESAKSFRAKFARLKIHMDRPEWSGRSERGEEGSGHPSAKITVISRNKKAIRVDGDHPLLQE